jgi:hypothetical protein
MISLFSARFLCLWQPQNRRILVQPGGWLRSGRRCGGGETGDG